MIPVVLICGKAKSGKDTVGAYLAEKYNGVCVAQADPIKLLARAIFGFTEAQLWGPSQNRNALDTRFNLRGYEAADEAWRQAGLALDNSEVTGLVHDLFPGQPQAMDALHGWMCTARRQAYDAGGLTPRWVLQTLGTEWGRALNYQVWTEHAVKTAQRLLSGGWVYTDHRLLKGAYDQGPNLVLITDGRFKNELLAVKACGGTTLCVERPADDGSAAAQAAGVQGHQSEKELDEIPSNFYTHKVVNDGDLAQLFLAAEAAVYEVLMGPMVQVASTFLPRR